MATPTLTVHQLAADMGIIGASTESLPADQERRLTRLMGAAAALIERIAPEAPQEIVDEALYRIVSYEYDTDSAAPNRPRDVIMASGAGYLLGRWRVHRFLTPTEAENV